MQEYTVIKKGASIHHCINIPEDFMDLDLEIKIKPLDKSKKIIKNIEMLYEKYPQVSPFDKIEDPRQWQREIRDEWI